MTGEYLRLTGDRRARAKLYTAPIVRLKRERDRERVRLRFRTVSACERLRRLRRLLRRDRLLCGILFEVYTTKQKWSSFASMTFRRSVGCRVRP